MDSTQKEALARVIGAVLGPKIGVIVNSAVLPDTREIATKKGFVVRGASVTNTEAVVMIGRLLYAIKPDGQIKDLLESEGFTLFEMTSDQLHRGLVNMPDREASKIDHVKANEIAKEFDRLESLATIFTQLFGEKISEAAREVPDEVVNAVKRGRGIHEAMEEYLSRKEATEEGPEEGNVHSLKLHIGAVLPSGEVLEAGICRHCAMEFIEGKSDGRMFANKQLVRTLMAFIVAHADEVAEKNAQTKAVEGIKASIESVTKH